MQAMFAGRLVSDKLHRPIWDRLAGLLLAVRIPLGVATLQYEPEVLH